MADVAALRARIVELASDPTGPLRGKANPNFLHQQVSAYFVQQKRKPPARNTFYSWFGTNGKPPGQALLECVPAFAAILRVGEHELWQAARIMPSPIDASPSIASSAHDLRAAHRWMRKTLADSGSSTAGEALVVDRILHHKLDYHMEVWPVVRGRSKPLHLHSWIVLKPVGSAQGSKRLATTILEGADPAHRRDYIRSQVITEGLWRALGLNWRRNIPPEWAHLGEQPLFIEVPVEERNRLPSPEPRYPALDVDRVLLLGAPWAHAELMAALLAEVLGFGSWDLRYLGHRLDREQHEREHFCRTQLAERRSRYAWAIAQRSDMMRRLRPAILEFAPGSLVIAVSFGSGVARYVADAMGTEQKWIDDALAVLDGLVGEIGRRADVVRVHIDDADVGERVGDRFVVDRHRMTDVIRMLTAQVLAVLARERQGPGLPLWGERFEDLHRGDESIVLVPMAYSSVRWIPAGA